jgi:hypothetical protein
MRIFGSIGFGPFRIGASQRIRLRPRRRVYRHHGCPIHHKRQDTANACARRMAAR